MGNGIREREQVCTMKKKLSDKTILCLIVFMVLHLLATVYLGYQKMDAHCDEYWTYGLANHEGGIYPDIEDGVTYKGLGVYNDYFKVDENQRFRYDIVWENQAADVHPPFYYVLFHTICSLTPGVFSKWSGLILNYIFLMLIDGLLYRLANKLLKNRWLALLVTVISGTTVLTLNMTIFIRMYMMLTAEILAISNLFVDYYDKKPDRKFYCMLYLLTVVSTLTQYYFLIYLFFLCFFFGMRFVFRKQWKTGFLYCGVLGGAGVTAVLIFHALFEQILGSGYRGQEAFANMKNVGSIFEDVAAFYKLISKRLFGNCMFVMLALLLVLAVLVMVKRKDGKACGRYIRKWLCSAECMLLFSAVMYVLVVAKIAPFKEERYIILAGWMLTLFFVSAFYRGLSYLLAHRRQGLLYGIVFAGFMLLNVLSLRAVGWIYPYTYRQTQKFYDIVEQYKQCSVVYVYDDAWKSLCDVGFLRTYKDYTFVKADEMEDYIAAHKDESIVLYILQCKDPQKILDEAEAANGAPGHGKYLYSINYASVFYID